MPKKYIDDFAARLNSQVCQSEPQDRFYIARGAAEYLESQNKAFQKTGHIDAEFLETLRSATQSPTPQIRSLCHSALAYFLSSKDHFRSALMEVEQTDYDLAYVISTMNACAAHLFAGEASPFLDQFGHIDNLMHTKLNKAVRHLDHVFAQMDATVRQWSPVKGRVVIMTSQMLPPPHAPSVCALTFSRLLQQNHNKQVVIVNTKEFQRWICGGLYPFYVGNQIQQKSKFMHLKDTDILHTVFTSQSPLFNDQNARECFDFIADFKPEMVLSIGMRNTLAECLANHTFLMMYPTQQGIPLTKRHFFHSWGPYSTAEHQTLLDKGISEKYLFSQYPGFELHNEDQAVDHPPLQAWEAAKFPSDAFVFCVVGLRLDTDVTDEFLETLRKVVEHPKAYVAFVGHFTNFTQRVAGDPILSPKCKHIGFQKDIAACYQHSDAYISPRRTGGGSAVAYALQMRLPCLVPKYGDAALAVQDVPELKTNEDIVVAAHKLIDDPIYRQTMSALSASAYRSLPKRSALLRRILEEFTKVENRRLSMKLDVVQKQFFETK